MPTVQLPDGSTAQFPDGMAPADIENAITAHLAAPTPPPPEGPLHSFGSSLGLTDQPDPIEDAKEHPALTALRLLGGPAFQAGQAAYEGAKRTLGESYDAGKSLAQGNKAAALAHLITAVPMLGPALNKMADNSPATTPGQSYMSQVGADMTPGNIGTALGTAAQLAPMALGGLDSVAADRPLVGQIPSMKRAGAVFSSLNSDLADHPVPLSKAAQPLQRAAEVGVRGGTLPKAVNDLLQRSQAIEPMTYPEARDYQSSLSNLSASDNMALNGPMRRAVAQLSQGLYQDIYDSANQLGRGQDYSNAMSEYGRAARLSDLLDSAKNQFAKEGVKSVARGAGLAAGGAAGYQIYKAAQK